MSDKLFLIRFGDLWWGPDNRGYTSNLLCAGLYTEEEARAQERSCSARGGLPGDFAESLDDALKRYPVNPEMLAAIKRKF